MLYSKLATIYIITNIKLAIKNMPTNETKLKKDLVSNTGVFEFIPTDVNVLKKMISLYNKNEYPNPDLISQYDVRTDYLKSVDYINKAVIDGRIREYIQENGSKVYAKQDLETTIKFDILHSLLEKQKLTGNYEIPHLDLKSYVRYDIKSKGKDLDVGKVQVMAILVNEFVDFAIKTKDKGYIQTIKLCLEKLSEAENN